MLLARLSVQHTTLPGLGKQFAASSLSAGSARRWLAERPSSARNEDAGEKVRRFPPDRKHLEIEKS
jgi:hypothetical protein